MSHTIVLIFNPIVYTITYFEFMNSKKRDNARSSGRLTEEPDSCRLLDPELLQVCYLDDIDTYLSPSIDLGCDEMIQDDPAISDQISVVELEEINGNSVAQKGKIHRRASNKQAASRYREKQKQKVAELNKTITDLGLYTAKLERLLEESEEKNQYLEDQLKKQDSD